MTDKSAATQQGAATENVALETTEDAMQSYMSRFMNKDAEKPSKEEEDETPDTEDETPEDEGADNSEADDGEAGDETDADEESADDDSDEEKKKPKSRKAEDDDEIEFTVDGKTHKLTVKEAKRFAGQEAALTRKSQEVAEARKKVESNLAFAEAQYDKQLKRAQEKLKPFANVDWMVLQQKLNPQDFAAARKAAQNAAEEYAFLEKEAHEFHDKRKAERDSALLEEAKATYESLSKEIKDFPKVYGDMRAYALKNGATEEAFNNVTDPLTLRLLHKAMKYDAAQEGVKEKKKVAIKKATKNPPKASPAPVSKTPRDKAAMARLAESGDPEDAVAVLVAQMKAQRAASGHD